MLSFTLSEVTHYRSQLADYPDALTALDEIENCDGNLEDAAINLAIKVGQRPDRTDWLGGLAKRYRVEICQTHLQEELSQGNLISVIDHLTKAKIGPAILVTPVVLYVMKMGVKDFCSTLDVKTNL
ncbi:hypothetical protein [Aphanothece sacrum]|uniref:Uncharacterized protein n=1 Tax=Aphanothece sacrum FPU1 TaxID=1920663 RepID=A0A401IIT5_APHSA|nr:hypothetical protein [Aphanothece sacrum]GBF81222.1 hypothetical protein AsFPU1_2634 [Aphanothece sacrum FPU1]GBF83428.1 hypothetical protein AsFPU3_0470 [Aphanothece sacrum FPU3]